VALITATGRIPTIVKRKGVYRLVHSFGHRFDLGLLHNPEGQRFLAKFGFHRQLRLSGCKEGDEVEIGKVRVKWKFPPPEFEESKSNWPTGFSKWHLRIDGIANFKPIETLDPTSGLSTHEVESRVEELAPLVLRNLVSE
jgi:hypothetical protein